MRFKIFAFIWFAALAAAPVTLSADDACCDRPAMACCDKPTAACCDKPTAACCDKAAMPCCDQPAETSTPVANCCDKATAHDHGATSGCCDAEGGCDMPCCEKTVDGDAIEVLFALDGQRLPALSMSPTRQTATVFFQRPVWVGRQVPMGKHVIQHDTERQRRGEPCTHIYAADDPNTPVAVFHCTHLEGAAAEQHTVVLQPTGDGAQRFLRFQFKGETAAQGYPAER